MKTSKLEDIKNAYSLKGVGDIAVDQVNSYPLTIQYVQQTGLIQISFPLSMALYRSYSPTLEEGLKEIGFKKLNYKDQLATLFINKKDDAVEQYGKLKNFLAAKLFGQAQTLICSYCKQSGSDTLILKDRQYVPAHADCHNEYLKSLDEIKDKGSAFDYLKGGLGAFVGALLPMILALIFIVMFNTSFGWLYCFSATGAITGYHFMKGAYGSKALIVSILGCCLAFIIFMYATCYYILQNEGMLSLFSFTGGFSFINRLIFSSNFFEAFGFETIFFILGLAYMLFTKPFSKRKVLEQQNNFNELTRQMETKY